MDTREKKLLQLLRKKTLSQSHGWDHLQNVLGFALDLSKLINVQKGILVPACLLHDLGRSNPTFHGKDSAQESCRQAKILLAKAGYSAKEINQICQVISQHDQPKLKTTSPEAKILKEADFLDGFGPRGISRSLYWQGESDKNFQENIKKLPRQMAQRFKSLEFKQSRQIAANQFYLAQVFYDSLINTPKKLSTYEGKYIVFEGISGTGKETQAKLLKQYLEKQGKKTEIIYHPTPRLKETMDRWRQDKIDSFCEALLLIADRYDIVSRFLVPALRSGKTVINLRSRISAMVYQARNKKEINLFNYLFTLFEPEPDIIFYFSLSAEQALGRINQRFIKTGEPKGKFEDLKELNSKQIKYKNIIKDFKNIIININASQNIEQIQQKIIDKVKPILL